VSARCGSCGAAILWCKTESDRAMPLDAEPVPDGNVWINALGRAVVVQKGTAISPPSYKSHFATCPNAAKHRMPK